MKRYWLFYGWSDTYEDAGSEGGLLDLIDWFDSVEAAYVAFAMAPEREYWGKPDWCTILDNARHFHCREWTKADPVKIQYKRLYCWLFQ